MNAEQRKLYIGAARKAFHAVAPGDVTFNDWRHAEVAYALGSTKRFSEFTQLDLTKVLIHFWALTPRPATALRSAKEAERLDPKRIERLAAARQSEGRLGSLEKLWEAIEPRIRQKVMWDRFKIVFFEELTQFEDREINQVRMTLERLGRDHPSVKMNEVERATS